MEGLYAMLLVAISTCSDRHIKIGVGCSASIQGLYFKPD